MLNAQGEMFMGKNLLLITPWIYDFAAYDLWIKPLGFLYLASLLRENGYHITYIDCLDIFDPLMQEYLGRHTIRLKRKQDGSGQFPKAFVEKPHSLRNIPRRYGRYGITQEVFNQRLRQAPRPDAVLVTSMMTYWYPGVARVIELVRGYDTHIPILLGGNMVTLCPQTASALGADLCLPGEGERSVLQILQGITGQPIRYGPDPDNLDSLPYPAFDLQRKADFVLLQTSRGCPFRCVYCASGLLYPKFCRRSAASVVREIEHSLLRYGTSHFVFYDDALCHEAADYLIPILRAVEAKRMKVYFHTPNALHAREITQELAELFYRTGFRTLRLGFETSNPLRQKLTGGKVTNEQFQQAVLNLRKAGFSRPQIGVYILTGLPGQSIHEVEESVDFVFQNGAYPVLTEFSPIPGTHLWPYCLENSPFDLSSDPLLHNNSILPCQGPELSWEDYRQLKLKIRAKLREVT
jgi:pyruvate-formate lyase-activating enzyme